MSRDSLNPSVRGLGQSATLAINQRSRQLQGQGRTIYKFGLGQSPFPVPDEVVRSLVAHAAEKDYLPVEGLGTLREAVAEHHRRIDGVDLTADGILIGPGSKELIFLAQLCFDGDLLVPTPCWVSYSPQARLTGTRVVRLPASFEERWRLSAQRLDAHCAGDGGRSRLMILNYPGNPDGLTYSDAELRDIAAICRKHDIVVVSDEIYGLTHHRGQHVSIARHYPEGTIISSGLSKWCGAGGWRLGTFAFPKQLDWLKNAMACAASETFTSVAAPIQYAAVSAFQGSAAIDRYLVNSRRILAALGQRCASTLRRAGARVHTPQGAFYLFVDFGPLRQRLAGRGLQASAQLCERALEETGVAFLAGSNFERPPDELTARLAYVDFDGAAALRAVAALGEGAEVDEGLLRIGCPRVLEGIDRLTNWLQ